MLEHILYVYNIYIENINHIIFGIETIGMSIKFVVSLLVFLL